MANESLFTQALGLQSPWKVLKSEMVPNSKTNKMEMHIYIGWIAGAKFPCPEGECHETECSCYDQGEERTWRHLNFFQYKCFIHARTPRIKCNKHGIKTVKVPWARPRSGFTLLMDGFILELARHMAIKTIADEIGETDTRIWRVIELYVRDAYEKLEFKDIERIGVDRVRRREAGDGKIEKKTKYIWLKNPENLTNCQRDTSKRLSKQKLGTGRAYRMRLELQAIYSECLTKDEAKSRMMKLTRWMLLSRLEEMKKDAKSLRRNMEEIINYFTYRTTNAMLEGTNSVISLVKRRARGFRNMSHFRDMIYLQSAGLDLPYVTLG